MPAKGGAPAAATASLDDDIRFQEWKECRASLERFDAILVDLRKFGFGLVTILLSANGYLFVQTGVGDLAIVGIFVALTLLIVGLFRVDRVHQVFIRAAVLRAVEIEQQSRMGLSYEIARWSERTGTATWGHILYFFFGVAAYVLALAGIVSNDGGGVSQHELALMVGCTMWLLLVAYFNYLHHIKAQPALKERFEEVIAAYEAVKRTW